MFYFCEMDGIPKQTSGFKKLQSISVINSLIDLISFLNNIWTRTQLAVRVKSEVYPEWFRPGCREGMPSRYFLIMYSTVDPLEPPPHKDRGQGNDLFSLDTQDDV